MSSTLHNGIDFSFTANEIPKEGPYVSAFCENKKVAVPEIGRSSHISHANRAGTAVSGDPRSSAAGGFNESRSGNRPNQGGASPSTVSGTFF
jgi:hypothetical protein